MRCSGFRSASSRAPGTPWRNAFAPSMPRRREPFARCRSRRSRHGRSTSSAGRTGVGSERCWRPVLHCVRRRAGCSPATTRPSRYVMRQLESGTPFPSSPERAKAVLKGAGRAATQGTLDRIAATLRAAAVSDEGRELLESGRLTTDLESSGFDLVAASEAAGPQRQGPKEFGVRPSEARRATAKEEGSRSAAACGRAGRARSGARGRSSRPGCRGSASDRGQGSSRRRRARGGARVATRPLAACRARPAPEPDRRPRGAARPGRSPAAGPHPPARARRTRAHGGSARSE